MPKRSNWFQDLVTLVERSWQGRGAKVTASAEVPQDVDQRLREIDVLIETAPGEQFNLVIAVEAKDHKRKLDITEFECLLGKYLTPGGPKVDQLCVVSHWGFTEPVIARAKLNKVKLFTLREALATNWKEVVPPTPHDTYFELTPRAINVRVHPPLPANEEAQIRKEGRIRCPPWEWPSLVNFATTYAMHSICEQQPELVEEINAARFSCQAWAQDFDWQADIPVHIAWNGTQYPVQRLRFTFTTQVIKGSEVFSKMVRISETEGTAEGLVFGDRTFPDGDLLQFSIPKDGNTDKVSVRIKNKLLGIDQTIDLYRDPNKGPSANQGRAE